MTEPQPLTDDYRDAVAHSACDGCRGAFSPPDHTQPMRDWHDKPHRLVYDLCNAVDAERAENTRLRTLAHAVRDAADDACGPEAYDAAVRALVRAALDGATEADPRPPASSEFAAAVEATGLLQDEYPDQMAARSCTCEPGATCGAHRLLARYQEMYERLCTVQAERRAMRAERDKARAALDGTTEADQPRMMQGRWPKQAGVDTVAMDADDAVWNADGATEADR